MATLLTPRTLRLAHAMGHNGIRNIVFRPLTEDQYIAYCGADDETSICARPEGDYLMKDGRIEFYGWAEPFDCLQLFAPKGEDEWETY